MSDILRPKLRERNTVRPGETELDIGRDLFPNTGLSRRHILGLLGMTGLMMVAGCDQKPAANGTMVRNTLPDPLEMPRSTAMFERDEPVPTPPQKLPSPPATTEPANTHGVLPRNNWTRVGADTKRVDPMGEVKLITFHHSGDPKPFEKTTFAETAQHLEWVRQYHRSKNYQDIAYHFAIDREGRVWQLRSLSYQGQHVRGNNEHNIGVVVLGNFQIQAMSAKQKEKVKTFGSLLRRMYNLPANRVYTHREIVKTVCPGEGMQPYLVQLRRQKLI